MAENAGFLKVGDEADEEVVEVGEVDGESESIFSISSILASSSSIRESIPDSEELRGDVEEDGVLVLDDLAEDGGLSCRECSEDKGEGCFTALACPVPDEFEEVEFRF